MITDEKHLLNIFLEDNHWVHNLYYGIPGSIFHGISILSVKYNKMKQICFNKFYSRYTRDVSRTPLFLSKPEVGKIPQRCTSCQGRLICEVQVLPSIIPSLRLEAGDRGVTPLEFGSVLVYTCLRSCWDDKSLYKNELVYLQAETL